MEQRRKIVIPTGIEAEGELPTPHFDTEATLAARPVVPLSESAPAEEIAASPRVVVPVAGASNAVSIWKRSTLILILLGAVGIGVAAGLAIGLYQTSRKRTSPAPVVARPPASVQQETVAQPTPAARVPQPTPQPTVEAPAVDEARQDSDDTPSHDDRQVAQGVRRQDEVERVPPPPAVVRDKPKPAPATDTDARADRRGRQEQRRDEQPRRRREENDENPITMPRSIDRARQEINRIRDIFEGRQP